MGKKTLTAIQRMQCAISNHTPRFRGVLRMVGQKVNAGVTIRDWIQLVIGLFVGIVMIPIVEEVVRTTNTTPWDFTGSSGAIVLFQLIPFIFIASVITWFVLKAFGKI